ncbi:hypothetical protein P167DRAFT_558793 [Morchella conica CCBAS932]|uniref:Uncharacterized protein n=1 Tax=Morchella conica CCBAS932 TaxID=1392247 RepID=A0A3N4L3B3_9PEZI|nr:hypothetical protein P167DRAFT_558793 [Morchella conica CCBAS932]
MATSSLPGKPNPKPANQKPLNTLCIFSPTPLNLYLGLTSLVSATSSLLYLTSPSASLAKLGGTPSPSALVLVQVVASGEALVSYLCLEGLFSQIPESRRLVVRAIGVYNLFHMGAFWWGHRRYVRNPKGAGMLAMGLAVGTVTSLWYGVC